MVSGAGGGQFTIVPMVSPQTARRMEPGSFMEKTRMGILFVWQLPHFLALAWMDRDDYRRGGLKMLGVTDSLAVHTRNQSVLYASALLPTSLLPVVLGLTGVAYGVAALLLTGTYVVSALRFAYRANAGTARGLFRVSLVYLPLLLMFLTVDGRPARTASVDSMPASSGSHAAAVTR